MLVEKVMEEEDGEKREIWESSIYLYSRASQHKAGGIAFLPTRSTTPAIQHPEVWCFPHEVLAHSELNESGKNIVAVAVSMYWACGPEATSSSARQLLTSERGSGKGQQSRNTTRPLSRLMFVLDHSSKVYSYGEPLPALLCNFLSQEEESPFRSTDMAVQSVENLERSWL